jgi:hypothetical protein
MREKLIELLMQADSECFHRECEDCKYKGLSNCDSILTADYLIENGIKIPVRCIECAYSERYAESRNLYECKVDKMIMRKNDYCSHGEPKEKGEE